LNRRDEFFKTFEYSAILKTYGEFKKKALETQKTEKKDKAKANAVKNTSNTINNLFDIF